MLGYFEKLVEPRPLNANLLSASLKFTDSAPAAYAPRIEPPDVFPVLDDGHAEFPFTPNWSGSLTTGAHCCNAGE
jgi:hypothetical protein